MDSDPYALAISVGTQTLLDLLAVPTLYRFPLRPDPQNTRSTHSNALLTHSGRPPLSTGLTLPRAWALSRRCIIRAAFTDQGCQSGWIARFNFGSTLACSRPCSIATTAQGLLHFSLEGPVPITGSAFSKLSLKRRCSSDFLMWKVEGTNGVSSGIMQRQRAQRTPSSFLSACSCPVSHFNGHTAEGTRPKKSFLASAPLGGAGA